MTKAYNFNPRNCVFIFFDENTRSDQCIDISIFPCDDECKQEFSVTIDEAKEIALVLLQQVDIATNAKSAKKDEEDDE